MSSREKNIRALDGIRGVAIIFVMLHHFEPLIPASNATIYAAKLVFSFGWVGVDLFFALSGFLITGILSGHSQCKQLFRGVLCKASPEDFSTLLLGSDYRPNGGCARAPAAAKRSSRS